MMENPLELYSNGVEPPAKKEFVIDVRRPKKVLHFSDGVLEEFSDDETDGPQQVQTQVIDTQSLGWGPWFVHYAWAGGEKALGYCDYVGEGLAHFLGITSPKYQLEISEYERLERARKLEEEEAAGWVAGREDGNLPLVTQPTNIVPI